jgi:putative transposase
MRPRAQKCDRRDYVSYHHQDRVHDSLEKDTPDKRPIDPKPTANATVTSLPRLGSLHHRYSWSEAAQGSPA